MGPWLKVDGHIIYKAKLEPKEDYYVFIWEQVNSYNLFIMLTITSWVVELHIKLEIS